MTSRAAIVIRGGGDVTGGEGDVTAGGGSPGCGGVDGCNTDEDEDDDTGDDGGCTTAGAAFAGAFTAAGGGGDDVEDARVFFNVLLACSSVTISRCDSIDWFKSSSIRA